MKSAIGKMLLPGALIAGLCGCVSTSTNEVKKWNPPERADAHVRLGLIYLKQNQYETASAEFKAAIAINPQSDAAYHAKGLLMTRIGDNDEAGKLFSRAVALNPKNYLAVNDYGVHLCQNKNHSKGLQLLSAIESDPANPNLLQTRLGMGICYSNSSDDKNASRYLRLVLDQSPSLPQALLPMAEISFRNREYLSARAFLERYFAAGSLSERSLFLAATVEHELNDANKANQYRRELKKRFPASPLNKNLDELLL